MSLLRWDGVLHRLLINSIVYITRYAPRDGPESLAVAIHEASTPLLREEYKQKKTRNFVSSPYPTLWLSDDDKVQPLPSNYGRFLSPCLVKLPPEQKMLTSSRVAFTPLVPHIRKNNILISVFDPMGTLSCRLMPIGCSHGHILVVYFTYIEVRGSF